MGAKTCAIVDYGMGNLHSVRNAVRHVGGEAVVLADPERLSQYGKIILPGVGAFGQAIDHLQRSGMVSALNQSRQTGNFILGICLGMQLMCSLSEEDGAHQGLDWFAARVVRFQAGEGIRIPHMGWNTVHFSREDALITGLQCNTDAYFVHSYHVSCEAESDVLATTDHGVKFHSMIQKENLRGVQFHPEKSQEFGLSIIRNFLDS